MTDPLRARAVAAVHAYRESGDRAHLDVLRQDGLRQLAHALTMEAAVPEGKRGRYTAEIDAWLGVGPVEDFAEDDHYDNDAGQERS